MKAIHSRTSHSVRNISYGLFSQLIQMVLGFVSRTIFISYLAVDYLGVNSLFTNIISVLSLAELGVGSAFIYALYKPLAEKNAFEIATIIAFYKRVYMFIGAFIFVAGLCLLPFLSSLVPPQSSVITEDIRVIYFLFLFNSASTYFFSYKLSLLDADQKSATITLNTTVFLLIQNALQILVLVLTQNFILYLVVQVLCALSSNYYISRIVDKQYPYLSEFKTASIDVSLKSSILKNTKATFLVKIGGILVNSTDNLIINYFVGLAVLGKFSNYVMLVAIVSNFLVIIFANIRSSVANFVVTESQENQRSIFYALNFINFWLYGLSFLFIVFLMNDFISLWIGLNYVLSLKIALMVGINFFMVGMQSAFWTFKSSYGFFRQGRYMVLLTALLNLVLSFMFGYYYGVFGVLFATAIARLLTNFWYDPYVVLTMGLALNPLTYVFRFAKYIAVLLVSGLLIYFSSHFLPYSLLVSFIFKICLCLLIPNVLIVAVFRSTPEFIRIKQLAQHSLQVLTKRI